MKTPERAHCEVLVTLHARGFNGIERTAPPDRQYPRILGADFNTGCDHHPFLHTARLLVQRQPDHEPISHVVLGSPTGPGAIAIPTIDGKIVMIKQWRIPLGRYTWELPRGFQEPSDESQSIRPEALPAGLQTALRELHEESGICATSIHSTFLGKIAENSGMSSLSPSVWLLSISGATFNETAEIKLCTPQEALNMVEDMHTAAAMCLYLKNIDLRRFLVSAF